MSTLKGVLAGQRSSASFLRVLVTSTTTLRPGGTVDLLNATAKTVYAGAGALVLLGAAVHTEIPHRAVLVAVAVGALAVAAVLHPLRRVMPLWSYNPVITVGTASVTTAALASGGTVHGVVVAWLFTLVVIEATYFFPVPLAVFHVGGVLLGLVICTRRVPGVDVLDQLLAAGLLIAVALLVHLLTRASATAGIDPLTGLLDRVGTTRRLQRAVEHVAETGDPLLFAVIGMDGFSRVNEIHGHAAGDEALRSTADRWRSRLPRSAVLGRWGGDQFALLVRSGPGDGWDLVQALRNDLPDDLRCSAGVVVVECGDGLEEVVDHAEGALAAAKRHRGGDAHLWAPGTPTSRGLLDALAAGDVRVHYQPVVRLADGATTGAEALVRWIRPDGTCIPPGDFLPQAEASGSIVALGRYVLERACDDAARWPVPAGGEPLSVAVDASGAELSEPDYAAWVVAALRRSSLPGERLVIEVVEGLLDEESTSVVENLHALRAAGVRLAVDDFGTGWSSLSRLAVLPLDILKIDRSFVSTVEPGAEAPVCAGVVALAQALDLSIVAEGVETAHQAAWLAELGCQEAQGWLYAPALAASAFSERLLGDRVVDPVAR